MQYPNIGAPSPQEIYDALKMIPNNAQGKQMLGQLAQQGKQTGSIEGGIATALLNSYNKAQQVTPPPPQGQVVDQVIQSAQATSPTFPATAMPGALALHAAQPPMSPDMQGIAMPGLEDVAQQNAQQMATGGIVALAQGGPVREFDWGGVADLAQDSPWMGGMPDVPEAPDTTAIEQDYFAAPEVHAPTTRTTAAGESKHAGIEEKINRLGELYDAPPNILAEMISKHEKDAADRKKFNAFEAIASGLSGYLGSYGSGAHRAGAGLASMLSTMGSQRKAESEDEATMEAYRYKQAMQPYEIHKDLVNQVLTAQTASDKAAAEAQLKMWEAKYRRETELMQGKQAGEYGVRGHEIAAEASKYSADVKAGGKNAWDKSKLTGPAKASIIAALINQGMDIDEIKTRYPELAGMVDAGEGRAQQTSSFSDWRPIKGLNYGWLSGGSK